VRHESCLSCRHAPDRFLTPLIALAELLTAGQHHHHVVTCEDCGKWWFDDVTTGGFLLPVPARRDTMTCSCPEDGADRYTSAAVLVPGPEATCHCTAADVERRSVRVGGAQ
jgi:hypothetical protein